MYQLANRDVFTHREPMRGNLHMSSCSAPKCAFRTDGAILHADVTDKGINKWLCKSTHPYDLKRFVPLEDCVYECTPALVSRGSQEESSFHEAFAAAWDRLLPSAGVVIITLRGAEARRRLVIEELHHVGLLPKHRHMLFWYIADRPRRQDGAYGCFRSHVAVAKFCHDNKWNRFLIAEDDMYFLKTASPGAIHDVADALSLDPGITLVSLGAMRTRYAKGMRSVSRNVHPILRSLGTTLIVGTSRYSRHLCQWVQFFGRIDEPHSLSDKGLKPIDNHLLCCKSSRIAGAHGRYPAIAGQRGIDTFIPSKGFDKTMKHMMDRVGIYKFMEHITHFETRKLVVAVIGLGCACLVLCALLISAFVLLKKRALKRE